MNDGPTKKGDWVTNYPVPLKGYWPRRKAKYVQGDPKATSAYTIETLKQMKYVGIYLDEDVPEGLYNRELIRKPMDQ